MNQIIFYKFARQQDEMLKEEITSYPIKFEQDRQIF
jgi:hypothetical protein